MSTYLANMRAAKAVYVKRDLHKVKETCKREANMRAAKAESNSSAMTLAALMFASLLHVSFTLCRSLLTYTALAESNSSAMTSKEIWQTRH